MSPLLRAALLFGAAVSVACGDDPGRSAPGGPGVVTVSLDAAGASGGAILLDVTGAVDSVTAEPRYAVFAATSAQGATVVVTGALTPGELVRIWVPDLGAAHRPAVSVREVATIGTYALQPPQDYRVVLSR